METFQNFPFDTKKEPINISQGFNGPWSHCNFSPKRKLDLSYSVDFSLPVSTEVLAVKKGVVVVTTDSSDEFYEGEDVNEGILYGMRCNFIGVGDIENKKRIIQYVHLARNSIKVKVGDIVNPGDLLAETGKSGWIGTVPHLHIHYSFFIPFKGTITMPFKFKDYGKSLEHNK